MKRASQIFRDRKVVLFVLIVFLGICVFKPKIQLRAEFLDYFYQKDWMNEIYCDVRCEPRVPCEYADEVDFRLVILTYNRARALNKTLESVEHLETLGGRVSVDIWIDRNTKGVVDGATNAVAQDFVNKFMRNMKKGRVCVHHQQKNAGVIGQWFDTWKPKLNTKEIPLIIEDDVSISKFAYRWLRNVAGKYGEKHRRDLAGYTLQMEDITFFAGPLRPMKGPEDQPMFLYPVIGNWGFSPHPDTWRDFQVWYAKVRPTRELRTDTMKPYVDGIEPTKWYKRFESQGTTEGMFEMWFIKYTDLYKKFTLYSNLKAYLRRQDVLLSNNRMEAGLHYGEDSYKDNTHLLLNEWDTSLDVLPEYKDLAHYNYDGSPCTEECCFNASRPCVKIGPKILTPGSGI